MSHFRPLSLGELHRSGLATRHTMLAALAEQKASAANAPPSALTDALKNPKKFAADIASGLIPHSVADWMAERIVRTEKDLSALRKAIDDHDALPQSARDVMQREKWFKDYFNVFKIHNLVKFWAMVLPIMRTRLKGRVKAPSFGQIRASKSDGLIPNAADVSSMLIDESDALVKDMKRQGVLLDGLVDVRTTNNVRVKDGLGSLGLDPASLTTLTAAGVAFTALITLYLSWSDIAATARSVAADYVAAQIAKTDPKQALKYKQEQGKTERGQQDTGIGGTIRKTLPWVVGGIVLVVVGAPVLDMVVTKHVAKNIPIHGLGCPGNRGCSCGCPGGRKGQLDGFGNCSCGPSSRRRRR